MGYQMAKLFKSLLADDRGAAAAEYALILAIVGSAIAVSALALGNAVAGAMDKATTKINAAIP